MSQLPGQTPARPTSTDIDLYCLQCGYNLRGLSGDPRRCPECGHLNPIGDLELPAELISAQLRQMETAPAVCVGAVLFGGVFLTMFAVLAIGDPGGIDSEAFTCFLTPVVVMSAVWGICALRFRWSCMGKSGWGGALWRYHLYGLLLSAVVIGLVAIPTIGFFLLNLSARSAGAWLLIPLVLASFGCAVVVISVAGRPAHRRLKEVLTPLQREVAVTIAREHLRRRLAMGRRGFLG